MYLSCRGEAGGQGGELPALAAPGLCDDWLQADCVGAGGGQARHRVVRGAGGVTVGHQLRELGSRGLELAHSYPGNTIIIIIVTCSPKTLKNPNR